MKGDCRFVSEKLLGHGKQGVVHMGRDKETNEVVAIKTINELNKDAQESLRREVDALKSMQHDNIIQLKSIVQSTANEGEVSMIVMEYAGERTLYDYVKRSGHFCEQLARTYFHQLLDALDYCHNCNIFHLDVKLENILLGDKFQLKLCDFGLSCHVEHKDAPVHCVHGSPRYAAPEVLFGADKGYNGAKADVWSAGVVLFCMLCNCNPFFEENLATDWWFVECLHKRYENFWESHFLSAPHMRSCEHAINLLNRIFNASSKGRVSIKSILQHDWMKGPTLGGVDLVERMTPRVEIMEAAITREKIDRDAIMNEKKRCHENETNTPKAYRLKMTEDVFRRDVSRSVFNYPPRFENGLAIGPHKIFTYGTSNILCRIENHLRIMDKNVSITTSHEKFTVEASLNMPCQVFTEEDSFQSMSSMPSRREIAVRINVFQALDAGSECSEDMLILTIEMRPGGVLADFYDCFENLRQSFMTADKMGVDSSNHNNVPGAEYDLACAGCDNMKEDGIVSHELVDLTQMGMMI